jgi:hypothetical protein
VILGKFICALPRKLGGGHKRGKLIPEQEMPGTRAIYRYFACPRCGRETEYKIKPQSPAKQTNQERSNDAK